jgi:predicted HNH restriction endonuclease
MSIRTDNTAIDSDLVDNNETATQTHNVESVTEGRVRERGTMNQGRNREKGF